MEVPLHPAYKISYIRRNVGSKGKAPLMRMPIVWRDDGLNIPPKPILKMLLGHDILKSKSKVILVNH